MTMALPARRLTVGITTEEVPAVRVRPVAAVNPRVIGSTKGAGAPETERRQQARARTTKPFGFSAIRFLYFVFQYFLIFIFCIFGFNSFCNMPQKGDKALGFLGYEFRILILQPWILQDDFKIQ